MLTAQQELDKFLDRSSSLFFSTLMNVVSREYGTKARFKAVNELTELMQRTMILADLHGRKRILMEADASRRKGYKFAAPPDSTPIMPGVPFEEAIDDLLSREPRLAQSAVEVSRLYSHDHVFAMAKSSELIVTKRVQEFINKTLAEGKGLPTVEQQIMEVGDFTRAYAATVYRTNTSTVYTAGRFAQAKDPSVRQVIPALIYRSVNDAQTRPNHAAAHGLIAAVDDPVWDFIKPPNGYQCRCGADFISIYELERRELVKKDGSIRRYEPPNFKNAHPDPGFKAGGITTA